jgi:hypothetical protein
VSADDFKRKQDCVLRTLLELPVDFLQAGAHMLRDCSPDLRPEARPRRGDFKPGGTIFSGRRRNPRPRGDRWLEGDALSGARISAREPAKV